MRTSKFWADTAERAIKTTAQTAVGLLTATGVGVLEVEWAQVGSVSAMAGIISILTSIAGKRIGPPDSPSIVKPA